MYTHGNTYRTMDRTTNLFISSNVHYVHLAEIISKKQHIKYRVGLDVRCNGVCTTVEDASLGISEAQADWQSPKINGHPTIMLYMNK